MLKKVLHRMHINQKGITGLETAIILIAFVVVASVFAYTALSAGLFSTQKSQEAITAGLKEVQSTMEIKGDVIAKAESGHTGTTGSGVSQLTFTITNALGGEPIDLTEPTETAGHTGLADSTSNNVVVISFINQDQRVEDLFWTSDPIGADDSDDMLDAGEKFQITIGAAAHTAGGGNLIDALDPDLTINKTFTIELKTPTGAVLSFERTTPAYIDSVFSLN